MCLPGKLQPGCWLFGAKSVGLYLLEINSKRFWTKLCKAFFLGPDPLDQYDRGSSRLCCSVPICETRIRKQNRKQNAHWGKLQPNETMQFGRRMRASAKRKQCRQKNKKCIYILIHGFKEKHSKLFLHIYIYICKFKNVYFSTAKRYQLRTLFLNMSMCSDNYLRLVGMFRE